MFPRGVSAYVDLMQDLIPEMRDGTVRTAIDTGCGVSCNSESVWSFHTMFLNINQTCLYLCCIYCCLYLIDLWKGIDCPSLSFSRPPMLFSVSILF